MKTPHTPYAVCSAAAKLESILRWLGDKKARELLALDIAALGAFTDAMVIASASSVRHGQGLADHVLAECRAANFEFLRMEGYPSGQWILLDLNDVVVHIFLSETRDMYRLDELWPKAGIVCDQRHTSPQGDA